MVRHLSVDVVAFQFPACRTRNAVGVAEIGGALSGGRTSCAGAEPLPVLGTGDILVGELCPQLPDQSD
jgi:hypothetical protein